MGDNNPDTDMQYDYDSLTLSLEDRINNEIMYFGELVKLTELDTALTYVTNKQTLPAYFQGTSNEVKQLQEKSIYPCYTLETTVLVIVPNGDINRYFHRIQKDGVYNVDDALTYKE